MSPRVGAFGIAAILATTACGMSVCAAAEAGKVAAALSKPVSSRLRLDLIRRDVPATSEAAKLVSASNRLPGSSLVSLRAELRSGDDAGVPIWCNVFLVPPHSPRVFDVMDMDLRDGQLVLAIYRGATILIYRVDLKSPARKTEIAGLSPSEWSLWAAHTVEQPGTVTLRLTSGPAGSWGAHVAHRVGNEVRVSEYNQVDGKWEFRFVAGTDTGVNSAK